MRTRNVFVPVALGVLAAFGSPRAGGTVPPSIPGSVAPASAVPSVLLLATQPGALHTSLYVTRPGDAAPQAPVATLTHLPGATVRASVLPGTSVVLATADTAETHDLSFNASLFRVEPHSPPERLCDSVAQASRPLVTQDGRVFVSRGTAGPTSGTERRESLRIDALSIDEVDPWTGDLHTLHTFSGYLAFLAGAHQGEVILYRIGPSGADIVGIDIDTGAVRTLVSSLPPFARDFSVDAETGTLVFQGRHETDARTWTIESVNLVSGTASRLHESASMNLVPHVLPGGRVLFNDGGRAGLSILGGGKTAGGPLGPGADWVLASSDDNRYLAALHTVQGALPVPFVLDIESGKSAPLRGPERARIAIAGFAPAGGGAK